MLHEGISDLKILGALLRNSKISGYQPIEVGGHSKLRARLKALSLTPHFRNPVPGFERPVRAIAIVLDAENDPLATFQSVQESIIAANLAAPRAPGEIEQGSPNVGVFLVPDNRSQGKIETLCLDSVRDDPAWHCLEAFFACFSERGGMLPKNIDKARAQAFLATRPISSLPIGLAADEGYWNLQADSFLELASFLRNVANMD